MLQTLNHWARNKQNWGRALTLVALVAALLFVAQPRPAEAHCDSINGPVVTAAQQALDTGNVKLVLPYVQPQYEAELTAAFEHAAEVRKLGGDAQSLADRFFFETAVRLHRQGEGAPYTGLNEETDHGPALAAADAALVSGSLDEVYTLLDGAIQAGVAEKYQAVQTAREHARLEGTVEADRERAEAELIFEKYIYELHTAAQGQAVAAEGGGHVHGAAQADSAPVQEHTK